MEVKYGTVQDIESWMELVQQVRWNFPGLETEPALEDHRKTVLRFMGEKRALCVKNDDKVIGVLLFSKKHNMICCLAVAPEYRKNGIASALLKRHSPNLTDPRTLPSPPSERMMKRGLLPEDYTKSSAFQREN